jgi:hypothetical protein
MREGEKWRIGLAISDLFMRLIELIVRGAKKAKRRKR